MATDDLPPDMMLAYAHADLSGTLDAIRRLDPSAPGSTVAPTDDNYRIRNALVLQCLVYALQIGIPAGIELDPAEPGWPVALIDLPGAGQVSWHLPGYTGSYDGHTTEQKYERIERFRAGPPAD